MELLRLESSEKCLIVFVSPVGMHIQLEAAREPVILRHILGYPSEMVVALSKASVDWGSNGFKFSGKSLWGNVISPEEPEEKPKEGEKAQERFFTLVIDGTYENYGFKILLQKEEVGELVKALQDYWFD